MNREFAAFVFFSALQSHNSPSGFVGNQYKMPFNGVGFKSHVAEAEIRLKLVQDLARFHNCDRHSKHDSFLRARHVVSSQTKTKNGFNSNLLFHPINR